jgi:hypothetical protein
MTNNYYKHTSMYLHCVMVAIVMVLSTACGGGHVYNKQCIADASVKCAAAIVSCRDNSNNNRTSIKDSDVQRQKEDLDVR